MIHIARSLARTAAAELKLVHPRKVNTALSLISSVCFKMPANNVAIKPMIPVHDMHVKVTIQLQHNLKFTEPESTRLARYTAAEKNSSYYRNEEIGVKYVEPACPLY